MGLYRADLRPSCVSVMDQFPSKERHHILGKGMRRTARRDKKTTQTKKIMCPLKGNPEGTDRTQQQILQQTDLTKKEQGRALEGLSLGHKLRNIRETGIRVNKGHHPGAHQHA